MRTAFLVVAMLAARAGPSAADTVAINEIFYRSPGDIEGLEWVELHNAGDREVDLGGWRFTDGVAYTFPPGAAIGAGAYIVLARDARLLEELYGRKADGVYEGALADSGERLTLSNARGDEVESVAYDDKEPWPRAADGRSASLERICPTWPAQRAANWAPSILSSDASSRSSGTPGKRNSAYSQSAPPAIGDVVVSSTVCRPGEPIAVEATVERAEAAIDAVEVLYRVVAPGDEGEERTVAMRAAPGQEGRYRAALPGAADGRRIVRLRVRARDAAGARRLFPDENDLRPALSVWIAAETGEAAIPIVEIFNAGKEEFETAKAWRGSRARGGFGGPGWWRAGGDVSRPFLANPACRRQFLARLETLCKTVYTEEVFGPKLDDLRVRLEPEARLRARLRGADEDAAARELEDNLAFFHEHLVQRRAYILANLR